MKRFLAFCVLLILVLPSAALDDGHAVYVGGTIPGLNAGTVGRLDTTAETSLVFLQAGNKLAIPYSSIESYEYSTEVTRHLGVLPAIVVGMIKMRRHRHFFRISYHEQNAAQVVVFEVPKRLPRTLQAILHARATSAHTVCKPCSTYANAE